MYYVFSNSKFPPHPNTPMNIQTLPVPNAEKTTSIINKFRIVGTQGISIIFPATPSYFEAVGE